jgi:hypothetical protein
MFIIRAKCSYTSLYTRFSLIQGTRDHSYSYTKLCSLFEPNRPLKTRIFGTRLVRILLIVDLPSLYRVIRTSTGIFAKPYNSRIAFLSFVRISKPGSWVKSNLGVAGGILIKLVCVEGGGFAKKSLKTRTSVTRLVRSLISAYSRPCPCICVTFDRNLRS